MMAQNKANQNQTEKPQSLYDQAASFVLRDTIEGGYVNDPRDPGGETNFGISKRAYPKVNMKTLTKQRALNIYKKDYWDAANCQELPAVIAIAVFDCAVNQGVGVAKKILQKALKVKVDGDIGPKTLKAAKAADPHQLLKSFLAWRLRRYAFTNNATTYMRGWSSRVLELQQFILKDLQEVA